MVDARFAFNVATAALLVGLVVFTAAYHTGVLPVPTGSYETTTVTIRDGNTNATEVTLTARRADTLSQKYVGLSRTDGLNDDEGMLFVFDDEQQLTFSMRGMSFPLDLIFIDENGRVTKVASADNPSGFIEAFTYETVSGQGTAVLEVRRGWADEHNVEEGDVVTWN